MSVPPPGKGRPKLRRFILNKTKNNKFSSPLPQSTKRGKTLAHKVELFLIPQLKNRAVVWKKRRNMKVLRTINTAAEK